MKLPKWFWIGLLIALFLRLALIPNPGFEADISFWKAWGLAVVDKGIVEGLKVSNNNYPTPFSYTLGAMVWIYGLFADPHTFNEFWTNTNLLFLTISKMFPILADFGIAGMILWMTSSKSKFPNPNQIQSLKGQKNTARISFGFRILDLFRHWTLEIGNSGLGPVLALLYLLSPISLIDGAWWGQVDSLGLFIFLLAVVMALKKMPLLAGAIYMFAVMTKLQNMIYGPIFFLFVLQTLGYNGFVRAITGSALAFFGLNIEFFLSKNMDRVIASLTENYDYFPLMSLNAYNLWWIVAGAKGMQISDKLLAIGIMNAKTVGLVLFSSVYLFAVLRQWIQKHAVQTFLESLILVNGAFFLFQTQSHDRYAFPLSAFLLLWAPYWIATRNKQQETRWKLFIFLFSLFTVVYFYNLHTGLVVNYPHNGIPGLSLLIQPFFTMSASVVLLGLFGVFVWLLARQSILAFLVSCFLLLVALIAGNLPLIQKKPVPLTRLTPYIAEQGYGTRQTNMPVNSFLGFPKWSFLSVQYAFYRAGIGTHAPSYIVYNLGGHFKKFTTDFGIDTEAGGKGSAVFEVYGDDKLLFRSDKIGRYNLPRHAEVNITGVKMLALVVTDAGDQKTDDHADWLRPTLWP